MIINVISFIIGHLQNLCYNWIVIWEPYFNSQQTPNTGCLVVHTFADFWFPQSTPYK